MRHTIHKLICWYIRRCSGAFHCYNYGENGRYVVLMNEGQYSNFQKQDSALREILISHGMYGDGRNLDKFTRSKCIEAIRGQ